MKKFLLLIGAFFLIGGCSSQQEITCGSEQVQKLAAEAIKSLIIGKIIKFKDSQEPTWEYIYPDQKIELKNIRVVGRNKETSQISCEAELESSVFDVSKTASAYKSNIIKAKEYIQKNDPSDKFTPAVLFEFLMNFKSVESELIAQGALHNIQYKVQPTEDKKSIYLNYTSDMSKDKLGILIEISDEIYKIKTIEEMIKLIKVEKVSSTPETKSLAPPPSESSGSINAAELKSIQIPASDTSISSKTNLSLANSSAETSGDIPLNSISSANESMIKIIPARTSESNQGAEKWSPSFDCNKASTGPERLICGSRELSELDVKLSLVYRQANENLDDKDKLRNTQRNWRKFQRDACSGVECIRQSYMSRIEEIKLYK